MSKRITIDTQISRASLFWLLFAQFALILPHVGGLPWWLFLVCLFCGVWRIFIYRGRMPFAGLLTRSLLVIGALVGVSVSFIGRIGLDSAVTFLILVFFFKLLETRHARDMYVTIFLGYFIAATQLLYNQSILAVAYALISSLLLTVALLALHHRDISSFRVPIYRAGTLLLQGLPVLLVLFLFFPRVDPFWSVPLPETSKRTGVSDSITLGGFGRLAQSSELAFRVSFDNFVPPVSELYWRGLVFEDFNGVSWKVSRQSKMPSQFSDWNFEPRPQRLRYTVVVEPSNQPWLFSLPVSTPQDTVSVVATPGYNLRRKLPIKTRFQYRAQAIAYNSLEANISEELRAKNLALPEGSNPRAVALAQQLAERYTNPVRIAAGAMKLFADEDFYYTLNPPVADRDSIDDFLFDSRRGYCEHYASSFVFLMRAAGVPARLVGGYLGGEVNPFENFISVRQLDAHAWAEIWLAGKGWVRYDPTAQVAPERIEDGAAETLLRRDEFDPTGLLGFMQYDNLAWMQNMRMWWDATNYGWTQWVMSYDKGTQLAWMRQWFGKSSTAMLVQVLALSLVAVIALLLLWMFRKIILRRRGAAHIAARLFTWVMGLLGSQRQPSETMFSYCGRVAEEYPWLRDTLTEFSAVYVALNYADLRYTLDRKIKLHWLVLILAGQVIRARSQKLIAR